MKYRIVEKNNEFIIEEYKFNRFPVKYGRYNSFDKAKEFLDKFINHTYGKEVEI